MTRWRHRRAPGVSEANAMRIAITTGFRTAGSIAHGSACCADARTRCTSSCNITRRHGHRTPDALPLPLARALELADRAEVVEPEDHSKRIARLRVEERLLADGPGAIDEAQDALRDAESLEVARRLQPNTALCWSGCGKQLQHCRPRLIESVNCSPHRGYALARHSAATRAALRRDVGISVGIRQRDQHPASTA